MGGARLAAVAALVGSVAVDKLGAAPVVDVGADADADADDGTAATFGSIVVSVAGGVAAELEVTAAVDETAGDGVIAWAEALSGSAWG